MGSHTGRDRARRWTLSGDALDARDGLTSGCNSTEGETPTMRLTAIAHHLMPFAALTGGILVLLMPRLLNYVVAIYLSWSASQGSTAFFTSSADRLAPRVALDAHDRVRP